VVEVGEIPDDEDVGVAGERTVGLNGKAATAFGFETGGIGESLAERRSTNAGGPEYRTSGQERFPFGGGDEGAVGTDIEDADVVAAADAELDELAFGGAAEFFAKGRQDAGAGVKDEDASVLGLDGTEVVA
jgi:hypothetical protein